MKLFVCTLLVSLPLCTAVPAYSLEQLTHLVLRLQLEILKKAGVGINGNSGAGANSPGATGVNLPGATGNHLLGATGNRVPGTHLPGATVNHVLGPAGTHVPGATGVHVPGAAGTHILGATGTHLPGATVNHVLGATGTHVPGATGAHGPGAAGNRVLSASWTHVPGARGTNVPGATGGHVPGAAGTHVPGHSWTSISASGGVHGNTGMQSGTGVGAGNIGARPSGVIATVSGTIPNSHSSSGISPTVEKVVIPVAATTTPATTGDRTTARFIEETTQNPVEIASLALLKLVPANTTDLLTNLTNNGVEITDSIKNQTDSLLAEAEEYGKKATETFNKAQASESAEKERLMVQYYKYTGKKEKLELAAETLVEMGIHISLFYSELQVTTKELAGLLTMPDVLPPEPLPAA